MDNEKKPTPADYQVAEGMFLATLLILVVAGLLAGAALFVFFRLILPACI